ncbi:PDZ domain-containing protein [Amycolatopsis sp. PS_44_ISF1]|uniref:S41 family peptidase n=1 Tax=Amycolatopsis sp. PS_44_ISF1 TaxID=2974917 RepID=UPI0028DFC8CF|nr:PDZ domain-containing protein [Amycolatopsis sp. PS_44_ISF1]MDT8909769.1 PDZ domain-containing protein [Amycolatopsis sp. PS_44_ISF1]
MAADPYLRHPHLSGDVLTFIAEDRVWLASVAEALAGTATASRVPGAGGEGAPRPSLPRLNPSATRLAWTSVVGGNTVALRGGAREVWYTDIAGTIGTAGTNGTDGGRPRQLTHWADRNTATCGWLSDTEVLARSGYGRAADRRAWMFAVPVAGPPREVPCGPAAELAVRADGARLVGTMTVFEPVYWKRYRGGCAGRLWYSPGGTDFEPVLSSLGGNVTNPMWTGSRMAFLSDHEGVGALYSAEVDGEDLRRHGELGPFYARNATSDGERVVYEQAGRLFLLASGADRPVELRVRLAGAGEGRRARTWSGTTATGGFVLDPTGRHLIAEVRGTLHLLPAEGAPRPVFDVPGARARLPVVTAGAATVVCVSDQGGEEGIDVLAQEGSPPRRLAHGQLGRARELVVAPDGNTAAIATDERLLTLDLASGELTELVRTEHGPGTGLAFSPGSDLLAWAEPWISRGRSRIRLARPADGRVVEVTHGRFADGSPVFTADGRYLAFLSGSTLDPTGPTLNGQLQQAGFVPGVRPHLVPLDARAASPFDASHGGWREEEPGGGEPGALEVDLDGVAERVVPFPVEAGAYEGLVAIDGGVAWVDRPSVGVLGEAARHAPGPAPVPRLVGYRFADASRPTLLAKATGEHSVTANGRHLAYRVGGAVHVATTGDDRAERVVDLGAISVTTDPAAEWGQMFDESWRLVRDRYWRSDVDGVDWPAIGARYRGLLDRIGCAHDLFDVIMEMHGELSVSHVGVFFLGGQGRPAPPPGYLGADLAAAAGGWRIERLLTGDVSSAMHRTPLTGPGPTARPGDVITAVDGVPVDPAYGPLPQLAGKAGQPVKLTLHRDGAEFRLVVVPTPHEPRLRHHDLTVRRRAQVAERTGDRVGYLRIIDMVAAGWADLNRDLSGALERTGLILDLRGNHGGDLHPLLDLLTRRVTGWHRPRFAQPYTWPYDTVRGRVAVLVDEFTTCGPENLVVSLQLLGAATLVGRRTHGSMTGSIPADQALLDGSRVSQPTVSKWWDGPGWLDGHGVTPDVEVDIAPQDWVAGRDPQLDAAIDLVLESLERDGYPVPPDQGPPTGGRVPR